NPEDKTGREGGAKMNAGPKSGAGGAGRELPGPEPGEHPACAAEAASARRRPETLSFFRRRRTRTAFLCAAFLVLGAGLGSLLTCIIIRRHMRRGFRDPDRIASHMLSRVRKNLDLTDEQTEKILAVLKRRLRAIRDTIHSEHDSVNEEIEQFLDEEQLAKHRKLVAERRARFFGPHSGGRGGKR
ncbi:unnamed protein product, partial [marine sediment metagenome]